MGHLDLVPKTDVSSFRKMAIGTWRTAYDPSVYGTIELRMEKAMKYIEAFRARTGRRITVSHLMAKALGQALKEVPDANAILRFHRVYLRKRIGVFFQVVMTDEGLGMTDLSGATVYDVEKKSLLEIADEFQAKVDTVRRRKDPAFESTRNVFRRMPGWLTYYVFQLISFLTYTLNLNLKWAGLPHDPFGSAMITNVGTLGLDVAYVPLVPYSRVPLLLAVGAVKDAPVVEDGAVRSGKVMKVNATFDHRLIDGFHAAVMSRILRAWLESPEEHFGAIDALPAKDGAP